MGNEAISNNINSLKENIRREAGIIKELSTILGNLKTINDLEKSGYATNKEEKKLLEEATGSMLSQLAIINDSVPHLVDDISLFKAASPQEAIQPKSQKELVSMNYSSPVMQAGDSLVTVRRSQKARFIKELNLTDATVNKLKKKYSYFSKPKEEAQFKKASNYTKLSNRLFSEISKGLMNKGYFNNLNRELRKANMSYLAYSYISVCFFTSLLVFFASFFIYIILLFFDVNATLYFFHPVKSAGEISIRLLKFFWILLAFPMLTFFFIMIYPSAEKKALEKKINYELPFVTIHMAAIAGSRIEPTNIFKIIVAGREYPFTKQELKKVINKVNVYGLDLVSALRETAVATPSSKLAELFGGLATTITSGGDLELFLSKRAETLIFDYKTESEKATRTAETFMDIYISVVIAAPMILTLLLVMMSISPALGIGLSTQATTFLILLAIAVINIIFLAFLHLKQTPI
jgi:hypothetical protein